MKFFRKISFMLVSAAMALTTGVLLSLAPGLETRAADTLYTTADFTLKTTSHTGYADAWDYGTDWNVFGGQNNNGGWAYIRLGGKSATLATANPVYVSNKSAMGSTISKVTISLLVGTLPNNSGVTQYGVKVYSDATMTTQIDQSVLTSMVKPTAPITYSFTPSEGYMEAHETTEWATGSYFKVFFDCTNTSTTNGIVYVDKVMFYKDVPFVAVDSVSVDDPGSSNLSVGTKVSLSTTVLPSDATDKTVTWSSSPTDVVRVLANGDVIPCNDGNARITATSVSDGTKSGYRDFVVSGQDLSSSAKTITTTSLGLAPTYVNGYFGTGSVYSLRGVMAKAIDGELQFGNNVAAGQGLIYNVSRYVSNITTIVITTGASGAVAVSTLYVGTEVNPATTTVTPSVNGTVATYDVSAVGNFKFFAFAMTAASGTNYYDSIVVNVADEDAVAYAQTFLSSTDDECASLAVTGSTWSTLSSLFSALSTSSKNVLIAAVANVSGSDIQKAVARYDYIVAKYGYTNFMSRELVSGTATTDGNISQLRIGGISSIFILSAIGLTLIGGMFFLKRKREE
jgi:uncharacterized protein YjdB